MNQPQWGTVPFFRKSDSFDRRLVPGRYLRAKVGSRVQSRVHTCSQLWKRAGTNGQNFTGCRCWPKWPARSSITGLRQRLSAAQWNPSSTRLVPWLPRFPGPLGHLLRPSHSAGSGLAPFRPFFFGPLRGTRVRGPKQGVSTLRADTGEYWAGKVRFRGPQWTLRMAP